MTKTFQFEQLDESWYGVMLINDGKARPQPHICFDFVKFAIGDLPKKIKFVVSDEPIEKDNVIKVAVYKSGYYRWSWRCLNRECFMHGMRRVLEDYLTSLFPQAGNENKGGEFQLWLLINK